eukprot:543577-Amphidinium_carterae.1
MQLCCTATNPWPIPTGDRWENDANTRSMTELGISAEVAESSSKPFLVNVLGVQMLAHKLEELLANIRYDSVSVETRQTPRNITHTTILSVHGPVLSIANVQAERP